jgi:hypothetical protein
VRTITSARSARSARSTAGAAGSAVASALLGLTAGPAGDATPAYSIQDLGTLGGTASLAVGVDHNPVVGNSQITGNTIGTDHAGGIVGRAATTPPDIFTANGAYHATLWTPRP